MQGGAIFLKTAPLKRSLRERPQKTEIKTLITELYFVLSVPDWKQAANAFYIDGNCIDYYVLLAKKLEEVQAYEPQTFAFITQFDLVKPAIYEAAMNSQYAEQID